MSNFSFSATLNQPIDQAIETLKTILHQHKLGIVSEVNVQNIVKNKLDQDMAGYRILGACNPLMAKTMIDDLPEIGTLLPCTIIARQKDNTTVFDFMNPVAVLSLANNKVANQVAAEALQRLEAVAVDITKISNH